LCPHRKLRIEIVAAGQLADEGAAKVAVVLVAHRGVEVQGFNGIDGRIDITRLDVAVVIAGVQGE